MKDRIDLNNLPQHIAVIMDGNGRWAKKKGAARIFGHQNAIKAVREVTEGCAELGVKYLTLYAFSTENWGRPREEIDGLMHLLVRTLRSEIETLTKNNITLTTIGDISSLPQNCQYELSESIKATSENNGLTLVLALNYSGRWELKEAIKEISHDIKTGIIEPNDINQSLISSYLNTRNIPDPELLIRTSGEMRISNFMLWQVSYAELISSNTLWPDFRKRHFFQSIVEYQNRKRNFGGRK